MKIAVDVDEILANLIDPVIAFHNEQFQTSLVRNDFTSYNFDEVWGGTHVEAIQKVHQFFETEHFRNIRPVVGAVEGVQKLKEKHDLFVVTSRQSVVEEQTKAWLNQHFPEMFKEIHVTNGFSLSGQKRLKKDVCKQVGASLLIDDCLEYALDCAAAGIPVVMLDYPWNQTKPGELPENVKRVFSWEEILREIGKMMGE